MPPSPRRVSPSTPEVVNGGARSVRDGSAAGPSVNQGDPVISHVDAGHARHVPPRKLAATRLAPLLVLTLTGCAVGPKYVRPVTAVESAWKEEANHYLSTQSPADSAWWTAFHDTTLTRLIDTAFRQNLQLQIAGLRILEARAQLGIAVGRQYPQVQAAIARATGIGLSQHAANIPGLNQNFWDYQVGFDAAWELDFWGKYGRGVKAGQANVLATEADHDDALVSLAAEVARTYAAVRTFQVLLDQGRENERIQAEGQHIADSRFRHGATSELDVTQATTLLESTRATIPQLQSGLEQAENALCTLLGQVPGSVQPALASNTGIPRAPDEVAVSVPAEMLRRRPDIRSIEMSAMAQADQVGVARSELYPSFSLFGTIGTQTTSGAGLIAQGATFSDLFGPGTFFYSWGPRIVLPLFNYGRIQNNVRVQDARLQQLLVAYQHSVLKAAQEVEDGLAGYLRAREATVFAQNAASSAQRSVDIALVQYREGAVDYQRVLDAQRSLLQEQNTLASTQSSVATSLIALYKALGGGWETRNGQALIPQEMQDEMKHRTNWGNYFEKPQPSTTSKRQ
jgi:NodT family efflux transporter outer membrane factor (OMF) lipoprotein